jgi:hypothetical protein
MPGRRPRSCTRSSCAPRSRPCPCPSLTRSSSTSTSCNINPGERRAGDDPLQEDGAPSPQGDVLGAPLLSLLPDATGSAGNPAAAYPSHDAATGCSMRATVLSMMVVVVSHNHPIRLTIRKRVGVGGRMLAECRVVPLRSSCERCAIRAPRLIRSARQFRAELARLLGPERARAVAPRRRALSLVVGTRRGG